MSIIYEIPDGTTARRHGQSAKDMDGVHGARAKCGVRAHHANDAELDADDDGEPRADTGGVRICVDG